VFLAIPGAAFIVLGVSVLMRAASTRSMPGRFDRYLRGAVFVLFGLGIVLIAFSAYTIGGLLVVCAAGTGVVGIVLLLTSRRRERRMSR
jgi:hypothetical protein